MQLEILSPEKTLFTGEVDSVIFPGSQGKFQILNNHAPIISSLSQGNIDYKINSKTNQIEIKCFDCYFKMGLLADWLVEHKKSIKKENNVWKH